MGRKQGWAGLLPLVPLVLAGALLTGCSDSSSDSEDAGEGTPTSAADRDLAFAECMRENGVEEFPDPSEGGLLIGQDSGIDPQSPAFLEAEEACADLAPQNGGADTSNGEPVDPEEARAWAQCVRDHGVPDFPDPRIDGDVGEVDMTGVGTGGEDPTLDAALEDCESVRPPGMVMRGNGPGNGPGGEPGGDQ